MEDVFPKVVFMPFGIPIRNSVIATWVIMAMIVGGVILLRKKAPVVLEMIVDFTTDLAISFVGGDPSPYVPFLGTLMIFIAVANLIGIVPLMFTGGVRNGVYLWHQDPGDRGICQESALGDPTAGCDRLYQPHDVADFASLWQRDRR
jgi:F0F1-type ATP synthase membrane subunit a